MQPQELCNSATNIARIIDSILPRVEGYESIQGALEDASLRAKRIARNVQKYEHLYSFEGVQSNILSSVIQSLEDTRGDLVGIQQKFTNRITVRMFLSSPETAKMFRDIRTKLERKDDHLKIIGMLGALNIEQRTSSQQIRTLLDQIRMKAQEISELEGTMGRICHARMIENSVQDITQRRIGNGFEFRSGFSNLATGVGMYEGRFGISNYEVATRELNVAARAGWKDAYYYLGMLYKQGQGVNQSGSFAKDYFQRGVDAGNLASISELANCYDEGIGVDRSSLEAVRLMKRAAEAEDPLGMAMYSWYSLHGHNMQANSQVAYWMSRKAVEKGRGQNVLACCYEHGIEVERDPVKAAQLYTQAIDLSSSWTARLSMARCYEQGIGVQIDYPNAAVLYKAGTELIPWQRPYFQAYYGMCLIKGRGVPQDIEEGRKEVRKSIRANNASGWFVRGECYRFGWGEELNLKRAAKCYQRAIEMGNGMEAKIKAKFALGCLYEMGEGGLPLDYFAAFKLFQFAANRMHQEAQWKVALSCESGIGASRQLERAVYYFRLAASSGHRDAQLRAAKYYMKGKGVPRNLHTAIQIVQPAAEKGDRGAKRLIRRAQRQIVFRQESPSRSQSVPPSAAECEVLNFLPFEHDRIICA